MLALILATAVSVGAGDVVARYDRVESRRLVPMLQEVIRFETYAENPAAHAAQKAWLAKVATELGFVTRDAGKITEIELQASIPGAPVLGLVVHGDVQPVDAKAWTFPPFAGRADDRYVYGRGSADDKGPLVQALLAMKALEQSGLTRTHTIRLLVGSEEESSATEMTEYLKDHEAPDYSLVLDSEFPVVVGEKAWDGIALTSSLAGRGEASTAWSVESLSAGLSPSIVPDRAEIVLRWREGKPDWKALRAHLLAVRLPKGTTLAAVEEGPLLRITTRGKSAHAGVNIGGGRNALVALASAMEGHLGTGGADDLLAFARMAGQDLHGTGLGLTETVPIWGRYAVNVATIAPVEGNPGLSTLYINLRRTPPRNGKEARAHLEGVVSEFNRKHGASLTITDTSYFDDEPLTFDPESKIVKTLLAVYARAVDGPAIPAISGGGTYAKRLPRAIAFGMWFPGKPYPGHDVDEKIEIADLHRGTRVLIHALVEIAGKARMVEPFAR